MFHTGHSHPFSPSSLKQNQKTWRISGASSICSLRALEAFLLVKAVSSAEEQILQNCTTEESVLHEKSRLMSSTGTFVSKKCCP